MATGILILSSLGATAMKLLLRLSLLLAFLGLSAALFAQYRFSTNPYGAVDNEKAEFGWSRLRYASSASNRYFGGFGGYGGWSTDYPKADRTFLEAFKRLTRINAKSTEQVVDLDTDDIFNWPFVYAVQVQNWTFTPAQALRMRQYLDRGGFLMVDDFHGNADWEAFMRGMRMVYPDRVIEDLPNDDPLFHVIFDLGERFQVPGEQYVATGRTYEKDGFDPKWRAIRDDQGRIVVAICHNMHLGDAWEWADDPRYPEKFASMAFRLGIDYIMYSMTH
jgi:hypothetical protein